MEFREDSWLARIFGYPVFRVEVPRGETDALVAAGELRRRISQQRTRHPRFFAYAKVASDAIQILHEFTAAGFSVVDVNVTLERSSAPAPPLAASPDIEVGEPRPGDDAPLLDVAGSAFRYSRFHLDPEISKELADRIKREWVQSYLRRVRGDKLFAAFLGGKPVGFLAALASEKDGERIRVIDLMGVAPGLQGRGIGSALIQDFFLHYQHQCDRFEVGTQVANAPSLRFYQRHGFTVARSQYVVHLHVPTN